MVSDISAVLWKEWRELFHQRGMRGAMFNWLIMVALGGIMIPIQSGAEWLTSPLVIAMWSWLPLLAVMQIVSDTFAGERERHTLETLLASRLSDRAILFGKITAVVLYGWSIQFATMILGVLVVNLMNWTGTMHGFSAETLFGVVPVILLLIILITSIGTLISLKAATVRQAYQRMSIGFILLFLAPSLAIQFIPGLADAVLRLSDVHFGMQEAGIVILALIVLTAGVLVIGTKRFQRMKLIEDM
jgi:ABC-2 type transport system permease protein